MSNEMNTPVDFSNPEALAAELEAAETKAPAKTKEKKPAKPRVIKVTFTADRDIAAGETITFDYELPKSNGTRGMLSGIPLDEMTDEQLKIEYRNANSVAYKARKKGKPSEKAEARLEAVKAKMAERGIQPTSRGTAVIDAQTIAKLIAEGKITVEEINALLQPTAEA